MYGGKVEPMRRLRPREEDPWPDFYPGFFKEKGFVQVDIEKRDPIFGSLSTSIVVNVAHYAEIKELPEEFEVLASNRDCPIQVIKHRRKLVYGTQFHPENYNEEHPDGKTVLRNFFKIAQVLT